MSDAADGLPPPMPRGAALRPLAALFLRLGFTAFGGPAAHIAMMEDEVVKRRRWLSREKFLDLVAACNLIPGPNSTEMAIHVGHHVAGRAGLLVAGLCFIVPTVLIVTALAWAYVAYSALPEVAGVLYGIKPVLIAVVVQALWRLGGDLIRKPLLLAVGGAAAALSFLGVNERLLLLGAGIVVAVVRGVARRVQSGNLPACALLLGVPVPLAQAAGAAGGAASFSLAGLFLFFLKVGSVLYGSGYVLLAFLRADLVERWGWLTEQQLLDAVAVGQVTPGPVFTTATFIGYVLGGLPGAALATVGIFLPAFFFVAVSAPLVPRLRASPAAGAFLDGVVVASLALMAVVTWYLGRAAIVDWLTAVIAGAGALALIVYRVNSTWLVLAGGALGLALTVLGRAG